MSTLRQLCDRDGIQETSVAKEGSMTFMLPSNVGIFDNVILDAVVVANIIGGRSKRWWYKTVNNESSSPSRFPRYARIGYPALDISEVRIAELGRKLNYQRLYQVYSVLCLYYFGTRSKALFSYKVKQPKTSNPLQSLLMLMCRIFLRFVSSKRKCSLITSFLPNISFDRSGVK